MSSMKGKRFLSLHVLAVLSLILFLYYTSIFVFLNDWLGLESSPGTLNAFLFSLFASLSIFSFFSCVFIDPGHVPSSYAPDVEFAKDVSFLQIDVLDMCWMNHRNGWCLGKWVWSFGSLSVCLLVPLVWIKLEIGLIFSESWLLLDRIC